MRVLYITPRLPALPSEISYLFVKDEIERLKKRGIITNLVEIDYKNLPRCFKNITSLLKTNPSNIDIIHAHFAFPYGFVAALYNHLIKKPLVTTIHGFDVQISAKLKYGINRFSIIKPLTKHALDSSIFVIANSNSLAAQTIRYGIEPGKIRVMPLGVDLQNFKPLNTNQLRLAIQHHNPLKSLTKNNQDGVRILFPKRLEKIYGVEYFFQSLKRLKEQGINDFITIFLGDDKDGRYHVMANQLNLRHNTLFLQQMPHPLMPYIYNHCDFVVVPSLVEGFGLVVAEALACGRPVIGNAVGGILDQIIHGHNGLLAQPGDPDSLAACMRLLIDKPSLRFQMSVNARHFAIKYLNIDERIKAIIELYRSIDLS